MDKNYILEVTPEQGQVILAALGELPAKVTMALIHQIEVQTADQQGVIDKVYTQEASQRKAIETDETESATLR